jgi:DnaK suppressor protein
MNKKDLATLEKKLRHHRQVLLREVAATDEDLRFLEEDRESEFEERAQEESIAHLLARLDDQEKHALEEIDAALHRMATGRYGVCEGCGRRIPRARLRALPEARICVRCAQQQESASAPLEEVLSWPRRPLPPDLGSLSDRELTTIVRQQVQDDGRIDMDELRIVCRKGLVYLEGVLPSKAQHSILLRLLTDVLGLTEIGDYLQIQEGPWEREDRTRAESLAESLPGSEPGATEDITEDILESTEEGLDYVPPVGPTPEED